MRYSTLCSRTVCTAHAHQLENHAELFFKDCNQYRLSVILQIPAYDVLFFDKTSLTPRLEDVPLTAILQNLILLREVTKATMMLCAQCHGHSQGGRTMGMEFQRLSQDHRWPGFGRSPRLLWKRQKERGRQPRGPCMVTIDQDREESKKEAR